MAVSSCVDDDKLFSLDDFPVGALPNFAATANDDGFVGLGEAASFNMEFPSILPIILNKVEMEKCRDQVEQIPI